MRFRKKPKLTNSRGGEELIRCNYFTVCADTGTLFLVFILQCDRIVKILETHTPDIEKKMNRPTYVDICRDSRRSGPFARRRLREPDILFNKLTITVTRYLIELTL